MEKLATRFGSTNLVMAYSMFRPDWTFSQEGLTQKATVLAEFWQLSLPDVMSGLRHAFALRDACIESNDSLRTGRSLDLWLAVLKERSAGGSFDGAAATILQSFLVAQTQSACCERTFSRVEELKNLKHV